MVVCGQIRGKGVWTAGMVSTMVYGGLYLLLRLLGSKGSVGLGFVFCISGGIFLQKKRRGRSGEGITDLRILV